MPLCSIPRSGRYLVSRSHQLFKNFLLIFYSQIMAKISSLIPSTA